MPAQDRGRVVQDTVTPTRADVAIICGGRDYTGSPLAAARLRALVHHLGLTVVFHGDARGADRWAARVLAAPAGVRIIPVPAKWPKDRIDRSAGHRRNAEMLRQALDFGPGGVVVIAFPGGNGTANMCGKAAAAGVPIIRLDKDGGGPAAGISAPIGR